MVRADKVKELTYLEYYLRILTMSNERNSEKKAKIRKLDSYLVNNNINTCETFSKGRHRNFKGVFSGLGQILPAESSLKTMKNASYFIKKVYFVVEIFKFLYFQLPPFLSLSAIA